MMQRIRQEHLSDSAARWCGCSSLLWGLGAAAGGGAPTLFVRRDESKLLICNAAKAAQRFRVFSPGWRSKYCCKNKSHRVPRHHDWNTGIGSECT